MVCAGAVAHSRPGMHVENARMSWVYIQVMSLPGSCDYCDFSLAILFLFFPFIYYFLAVHDQLVAFSWCLKRCCIRKPQKRWQTGSSCEPSCF